MNSASLDALVAWIGEHPIAAGLAIFLVTFCDAVVILGVAVPAVPILFAVGTLVGLGMIDGTYAVVCAALGAFCGDALSFIVGRHYGDRLTRMWPFSRHPDWLASGDVFFRRHGIKGILIARYVGAVRPFVPAIAGMLRMRLRSYVPASAAASLSWGAVFIAPGWIFGASIDLFTAVAGRLAIVLGSLLAALGLIYLMVDTLYGFFAPRAANLIERALAWSHRHPVLGRFSAALIDPNRPESASLLLLALLLIGAGWAFFALLVALPEAGHALRLDAIVHQALFGLRTPLADHLMAMLAALGDWQVLGPASLLVFVWLLWRRRRIAAWHWLAAIGFGLALVASLGFLLDMPPPPAATAVAGFGFPSAQVTMATVVYGFFAVLIARELPGRRRAWPYVLAGLLVTTIGFARLYFGAHWLSDVLGGALLGLCWIALLGLAYRRRVTRSFWIRPIASLFFAAILVAGAWHGHRSAADTLTQFQPPETIESRSRREWWSQAWATLPTRRNEFSSERAWPLNLQYAGSLPRLQQRLEDAGWTVSPLDGWSTLLRTFDKDASPDTLPVLPASHNGRRDVLLMSRPGPLPEQREMLHLWASPLRLEPEGERVWQGTVATLSFQRRLGLVSFWRVEPGHEEVRRTLALALPGLARRDAIRPGGETVLLLAERRAAAD